VRERYLLVFRSSARLALAEEFQQHRRQR